MVVVCDGLVRSAAVERTRDERWGVRDAKQAGQTSDRRPAVSDRLLLTECGSVIEQRG